VAFDPASLPPATRGAFRRVLGVMAGFGFVMGGLMLVASIAFTWADRRASADAALLEAEGVVVQATVLSKDRGTGKLPSRWARVRFPLRDGTLHETVVLVDSPALWGALRDGATVPLRMRPLAPDHHRLEGDTRAEPMDAGEFALLYGMATVILAGGATALWLRRRIPPA
jgi:hypothetical protein